MSSKITYLVGDATSPVDTNSERFIIHCCNTIGAWGAGFVIALSKKWKTPEREYYQWYRNDGPRYNSTGSFNLGQVQFVEVGNGITVVNMIGQDGIGFHNEVPPIRYEAIEQCLQKVSICAKERKATIHCPRFGAGLAGGNWKKIEQLIEQTLCSNDINTYVYDLQ